MIIKALIKINIIFLFFSSCTQRSNIESDIQIEYSYYEDNPTYYTIYSKASNMCEDFNCDNLCYFVGHIKLINNLYYVNYYNTFLPEPYVLSLCNFIFFDPNLKVGDSIINEYILDVLTNDTVIQQQIVLKNEFSNNQYILFSQKFYRDFYFFNNTIGCLIIYNENTDQKYVDEYYNEYIKLYFLYNVLTKNITHVATINEQYSDFCPYYSYNSFEFNKYEILLKYCK
jgi:hypothetical protein